MLSVGLVGLDYCGSTLLCNLLGGLPGCIGVGETHWIIDNQKNKTMDAGRCRECGPQDCPIFTDHLLKELNHKTTVDTGSWWRTIADSSGSDIVISGDKRPRHYEKLGVPDKLIFIIKDPRAHIVSKAARVLGGVDLRDYSNGTSFFEMSDDELDFEIGFWIDETERHLDWALKSEKPVLAISIESLIKNNQDYIGEIAQWIGTEYDQKSIKFWESELHYIGGNHSMKRLDESRYFFRDLKVDKRWKNVLNENQQNYLEDNLEINYQLRRLENIVAQGTEFFHCNA